MIFSVPEFEEGLLWWGENLDGDALELLANLYWVSSS
jgi:hypothetical protein